MLYICALIRSRDISETDLYADLWIYIFSNVMAHRMNLSAKLTTCTIMQSLNKYMYSLVDQLLHINVPTCTCTLRDGVAS